MKKLFGVLVLGLILTGCDNYSVEELKNDPELRNQVLQECAQMEPAKAKEEQKCINATEALKGNITDMLNLN